ncbi:phage integrase SAM-like domain-containing protein [Paenisporosarcina sp.]|uniref:phage integrase SAM-like domain-containing protein n=1 Tax=Paenisporosarcina sp. TaxID=1932001 RepID=UPI003C78BA19
MKNRKYQNDNLTREQEKKIKRESVKIIFEKFLEAKLKQNLRVRTLNQHVLLFKNIENFHVTRTEKPFYLTDITTEFISDWVYWQKNICIKNENHRYMSKHAQTVGIADATIEGNIKYLKAFVNWCMKEELFPKNPFDKFEGFKKDSTDIDILTKAEINSLLKVLMSVLNTVEDSSALTEKSVPHPFLGQLPLNQWIELIYLHEQRHIEQIKEIKSIAKS